MMEVDVFNAIILFFVATYCVYVVMKNPYTTDMKALYFLTTFAGILVYSGISTLYVGLCEKYFVPFLIYAIVFSISFIVANYVRMRKYEVNYNGAMNSSVIFDTSILSDKFLLVMTILNFMYVLVQLVYPENRLSNLYTFAIGVEKIDFFNYRDTARSLPIYQFFYYISLSTMVFLYIYVDRLIKQKKIGRAILIIVLNMYLSFALTQYIGRSGMVANILFLLLLLLYGKKGKKLLKGAVKLLAVLGILFFLSMPAMYAYEFTRLGRSVGEIDKSYAIQTLIWQETNYGTHYQTLVELHSGSAFLNWFLWLTTLPIPSFLAEFKSNLLLVNQALSEYVTGVPYGHMYYFVKLPSLFGEGLYVFGPIFFWIHAAVIGVFINKFSELLEKHSELGVLNIYFATSCLLIGRGGSSSLFPQAVNYIVFFGIMMFILYSLPQGKCKRLNNYQHYANNLQIGVKND